MNLDPGRGDKEAGMTGMTGVRGATGLTGATGTTWMTEEKEKNSCGQTDPRTNQR